MSDRALSEEAMLASLRDIHLPALAPGGSLAELSVAVGLAALAALVLAAGLRALTVRRPRPASSSLQDRIVALQTLPEDARRIALMHLIREHAPERYAELRGTLYAPDGGLPLARLESEVARLV